MKIPKLSVLLVAVFAMVGALGAPHARAQVSVSYFYDNLSPYGEWVDAPGYGYCWHPTGVADNWAPYTDGYWAYTDSGWTWVSYEDYGGVVYHYGRWTSLPGEGWVWVPGYTWGPAWVSWRYGGDYCGWAPLPPEARWSASVGFGYGVDAHFDIGPGFFNFVRVSDFGAPALGPVIVSREQNVTIINNTTNVTNITTYNSNVYAGGPSYAALAAHSSRPIPTLKLVRSSAVGEGGKMLAHQQGNQLMVVAPHVTAPTGGRMPAPAKVAKTLTGVKAEHGWAGVKDSSVREQLRNQIQQQGGAKYSAKPVNPEEIKAVNERIKSEPTHAETASEPTPEVKGKGGKKNSDEELLNTPAKEEGGAAAATETPKPEKKNKKAKTEEGYQGTAPANAEETPRKSHKTSDEESGATPTPSKHKKSSESGLQPFMGGDESPKAKSKQSDEDYQPKSKKQYSDGENYNAPKSSKGSQYEGRGGPYGTPGGESGKGEKKSKKDQQQGNPYGPGQ